MFQAMFLVLSSAFPRFENHIQTPLVLYSFLTERNTLVPVALCRKPHDQFPLPVSMRAILLLKILSSMVAAPFCS